MSGFAYFLPDVARNNVSAETIAQAGLSHAWRDHIADWGTEDGYFIADIERGPSGGFGALAYLKGSGEHAPSITGYFPDRQKWVDCGQFWLGYQGEKPTPADLQRPISIEGERHILGDGNEWMCPIIRWNYETTKLPRSWGVGPDNKVREVIIDSYRWAWELSGKIWDATYSDEDNDLTIDDAFQMSIDVLSLNYRLGPHESTALQLLNSHNYTSVFHAAVNGAAVEKMLREMEEEKKTRDS